MKLFQFIKLKLGLVAVLVLLSSCDSVDDNFRDGPIWSGYDDEPENVEWIGYDTYVVQLGDQVDRCRPSSWYRDVCADDNTYKDEGSDLKIMRLLDNLHLKALEMLLYFRFMINYFNQMQLIKMEFLK